MTIVIATVLFFVYLAGFALFVGMAASHNEEYKRVGWPGVIALFVSLFIVFPLLFS